MDGTNLTDIGVAAAIVGGGYLAFKLMGGGGGGGGGWTPSPLNLRPQPAVYAFRVEQTREETTPSAFERPRPREFWALGLCGAGMQSKAPT